MLTISADIETLSKDQREALCGFIQSFPLVDRLGMVIDTDRRIPAAPEPEPLEDLSPEQAFAPATFDASRVFSPDTTATTALDKSGLPWDERIHSSSKALTADGCWRKKRGVDERLVAQVEAQLKNLMGLPSPAEAAPVPAPIASVPAPPAGPIMEVADGAAAYINFVGRVSDAITKGKLTQDEVIAICQKHGVVSLTLLAHRFDLVPQIAMEVEGLIVTR